MDAPELEGPLSPPSTLTPSKLERFISCPLSFRYAYVDRLPEPPSVHQVRGTVVHRALELLYAAAPKDRTPAAAREALVAALAEHDASTDAAALGLVGEAREAFRRECAALVEGDFALEEPHAINPVGLELDLRCRVEGVELRGILDRLDRHGEALTVVDYKTGRAPTTERAAGRLGGVSFYALLCEEVLGERPAEVRLVYLRDRLVITRTPTDQSTRGTRQRALAVWAAIERACASGDFRPNPSRLCAWCAFRDRCPAAGATAASSA